ncbi:dienelactone hydrolase family protein [Novosphingobium mangrovi (ex Hu et al. 2023)]|uniref:Dienelactone hydrolase family protein n=1 Tax=Novosphingobium mangrovi (ex Hu et al. 2023) TaxID=2930094 RepID=A0ABT0AFI5_9SPHN|nr:dienelactone hydrolase family protein [Novosphingobium mangrovi (ex Hu et al. 2023)]MCJ1961960.1 dienelactone hydrolase family protein [Novosphingobium mangrovi (ex Hu et al. 2023)]
MCDEFTEADDATRREGGLNRRQFAALGAGAALVGCAGKAGSAGEEGSDLRERMVSITTEDGVCDAFFVHPSTGQHPGIVMWPDIAGLRDAKKIMARALAAEGYAVLVVNQYYRSSPAPVLTSFSDWRTEEGKAKIAPMREALSPEAVTRDGAAFVAFLDAREEVDTSRKIGSNGYCMGGPFTVRTAIAAPERVGAAASFHGAGLVTGEPDSPDALLDETKASYLFAIARNDDARQPEQKTKLREAAASAGREAEIEVYDADHGWCVPDSPAWDPEEADRAWKRMMVLFASL